MNIRTINDVFYSAVERDLERAMMFKQRGQWMPTSSRELYRQVVGVARTLESWGLRRGDRVAILSENRPEWAITDFAAMLLGAATVPIYATLTPEQSLYLLRDSGARFIFVSNAAQLRKVMCIREQSALEKIVLMDTPQDPGIVPMEELRRRGAEGRDAELDERARAIGPDDLATVIYTSGTTGTPKGAMLTQGNLASNLLHSLDGYDFRPGQVSISFLPLSHVTARHVDYAMFLNGVTIAYCPVFDELLPSLAETRPHYFVGVPRVYEKIHSNVVSKAPTAGLKKRLYDWAVRVGKEHKSEVLSGRQPSSLSWKLADKLVFSKLKHALGGRVEAFISGGAPLNPDLIDWYGSVGIRIYEGYGLTETSPVIALNNPNFYHPGSVGKVLKNVEVRIAADDEILVRGPSIFKGYWNLPNETEAAFDDGWFRTGDVGRVDENGFLFITDRKKDLIKTSGGKFIAPQPIEGKLKNFPLVSEAALIADRRKFASAIIAPDFPALEEWARQNNVPVGSREELIAHPSVRAFYESQLAELNKDLAQYEKIKKFLLVAEEFSIASGALTPTMKLKRRFVEERYRKELDGLYDEVQPAKAS